jgi:adenylyl-sulfate kinase
MQKSPLTIWLTGLSGSGKSSIAFALENRLTGEQRTCVVLDGDKLRHGLNNDLGFTREDRRENIRRAAEVAKLFNDVDVLVIAAFISPYREDRLLARDIIGNTRFVEVHVAADIETCIRRDPKSLYRKALAGEITDFTGVSAPYEVPEAPALTLHTANETVASCVDKLNTLVKAGAWD